MDSHTSLSPLFKPRSIALVGASTSRIQGVNLYRNLRAFNYAGSIHPIHPSAGEFQGVQAFRSIEELPQVPDCALFVISSDKTVVELERAGRLGVRAAVVYASGFSELNGEGQALEVQLAEVARRYGMALCGPNCMGFIDFAARFPAYTGAFRPQEGTGNVAVLSHSGSGCVALGNAARFKLSYLLSSGNSAVLDMSHYLDHLSQDESTDVACLLLETIRDPNAFRLAAQLMYAAGKRIVALKTGRSAKGMVATAAHTGAVAGSYETSRYFLEDCGVIVTRDVDELLETTTLLSGLRRVASGAAGIVSISGGQVGMVCDIAADVGLQMPDLQPKVAAQVESRMPKFAYASNPLDVRTLSEPDYAAIVTAMAADPALALVGVVQDSSVTLTDSQAGTYAGIARAVVTAARESGKPFVFINALAAPLHPAILEPLEAAQVPMLRGLRSSIAAVANVLNAKPPSATRSPAQSLSRDALWASRLARKEPLTEREGKLFLAACGLPVPLEYHAVTAEEAAQAAQKIGGAVVLKVDSPDIQHKTEVGGIRLNVSGAVPAAEAFNSIRQDTARLAPSARFHGVLVQQMVEPGVELLAGLTWQEPYGYALTVGWGGIYVELLKDCETVLLPTDETSLRDALDKTRVSRLLDGYRGSDPLDKEEVIKTLLRLSEVVTTYSDLIEVLEVNPLRVRANGSVILDALLVTRATDRGTKHGHS